MIIRLKFRKEGPIKFVGHLDLMRTFQKMFMRSGIPVAYSEGFNPHQIFSFATALAVGVTSEGEYMDLRLTKDVAIEVLIKVVNAHAPSGILFTEGVELASKEPKAMAAIVAARYTVTVHNESITQDMIDNFVAMDEIIIQKKNKKGKINDVDLKPGIFELSLSDNVIEMLIATGSAFNIKPEMLMAKLVDLNGMTYDISDFAYHRVELYQENKGLKSLIEPKIKL